MHLVYYKKKSIYINSLGIQNPNVNPQVNVATTNLSEIRVRVFKADYIKRLKERVNDPNIYFNNFQSNFGYKIEDVVKEGYNLTLAEMDFELI